MSDWVIGIEIGGTKLQLVAGASDGSLLERRRFAVDPTAGGQGIRLQIESALPGLLSLRPASAIGVGFGGPVDWQSGRIACSHQIPGWSEFPMAAWLGSLSGLPVAVDNDANVAALAEACVGAGRGFHSVFYVTLGSGVGGGFVQGRSIYHGAKPGECEIGHLRLDRAGQVVEQRCSGWATDRRIREAVQQRPESLLARLIGGHVGGEARHLVPALQADDPTAQVILQETACDLGLALSHVTHLFHPEVIVLGGGLSLVGEPLRRAVAEALPSFLLEAFHPGPGLLLAGLSEDAVPVGALLLAGKSTSTLRG